MTGSFARWFITAAPSAISITSFIASRPFLTFSLYVLQKSCVSFLNTYFLSILISRLQDHLRRDIYKQWLHEEPYSFFEKHSIGSLLHVMLMDTKDWSVTMKNVLASGLQHGLLIMAHFFQLFWISPKITASAALAIPIFGIYGNYIGGKLRKLSHIMKNKEASILGRVSDALTNIKLVMAYNGQNFELKLYKEQEEKRLKIQGRFASLNSLFQATVELAILSLLPVILAISSGAHQQTINFENLPEILMKIQQLQSALGKSSYIYSQILKLGQASERLILWLPFSEMEKTISPPLETTKASFKWNGGIEFRNFTFAYPSAPEKLVYENFNLEIKPGEIIALCGPSGTGKSTLIHIIERFYDDFNGKVLLLEDYKLNGISNRSSSEAYNDDLRFTGSLDKSSSSNRYQDSWLRSQISYISQDPVLLSNDTILNNIKYGSFEASDDQVIEASKLANCHEFLMSDLPQDYHTIVSPTCNLSGGQRQRISIARALIRQPKLVILDEATSALDPLGQKRIYDSLREYKKRHKDVTIIIVAHQIESLQMADRVVLLGKNSRTKTLVDGTTKSYEVTEVIEQGTHEELISQKGAYFQLFRKHEL